MTNKFTQEQITLLYRFMAHADGILRNKEVEFVNALQPNEFLEKMNFHQAPDEMVSIEDCIMLIKQKHKSQKLELLQSLWKLSVCDNELHPSEEILFYNFCDAIGVKRRDLAHIAS